MKTLATHRLESDACSSGLDQLVDEAGRLEAEQERALLAEIERERDRAADELAKKIRDGIEARKRALRKTIALPDALFDELEKAARMAACSAEEMAIRLLCSALKQLRPEAVWPRNIERRNRCST